VAGRAIEPITAAASAAVYDPAQAWNPLLSRVMLPPGSETLLEREGMAARCIRVVRGNCPSANAILVVVPDRGFDRAGALALGRVPVAPWTSRLYLAVIDEEMTNLVSRSGFGFENLVSEVKREYGEPLVLVRLGAEDEVLPEAMALVLKSAGRSLEREQAFREAMALASIPVRSLGISPTVERMSDLKHAFDVVERARAIRKQLRCALLAAAKSPDDSRLAEQWASLAERSRERCLAAARGASVHGVGAEEVIAGLADVIPEVEQRLDADFQNPPAEALGAWAKRVREVVAVPELVLPVVGVFSSGKTTLINHLLGPSREGHSLLRTSQNHNTALLTRFHHGEQELMRLSWRSHIDLELVWHGDPSKRPIRSPADGVIESVQRVGGGWLATVRTRTGVLRWVHLDEQHRPLRGVREGTQVRANDALSVGIDTAGDEPGLVSAHPTTALSIRPWTITSMLRFFDENRLSGVRLDVQWRKQARTGDFSRTPFVLRYESHHQGTEGFAMAVAALRDLVRGRETKLSEIVNIPTTTSPFPVHVQIHARVVAKSCEPHERALASEADWTWFQGPPLHRSGEQPESIVGFAETAEAAWLVEQADLYINAPLFRLVSIVDTPGMDSISEHHDRTTEGCIHRGQAFLVMVRLGHATLSAATERTFHMIVQSLAAQGISQSEWGERVFVVLNWFRRDVGAWSEDQARASANKFRDRLRTTLSTEAPRVFLVELSPNRLMENRENLLGYPSLAALKRQLRSFIGVRGVALRLRGLREDLQKTVARIDADLTAEASGLSAGSEEAARGVERTLARILPGGDVRRRLMKQIEEAVKAVVSPVQTLQNELNRDYDEKEDFRQARSVGEACMVEYNRARNALKTTFPDELDAAVAREIRPRLQSAPRITRNSREVEKLPVMATEAFVQEVDRIVREWPWILKRSWHAVRNFEYYVATKRKDLRGSFVSDTTITDISDSADAIGEQLGQALMAVLDQVASQLQGRLDDLRADATRQGERRREVEEARRRLANFRPAVARTVTTMDRVVAHIEGLGQHDGDRS